MNFTPLKECLDNIIIKRHTPGADCIVYKGHEMLFRYYTGLSDIENKKKMNGNELYIIFSMTKMLTCVCALQLFEQGKFLLSDKLSKYMPEFEKMAISNETIDETKSAAIASGKNVAENQNNNVSGYAHNPITINDLFTMSSGLDYNLNADGINEAKKAGKKSTREIVGALSKTVLGFEPGTRYRYSLSHDVLGALIEIWSGMKFGEYLKKYVLEPLGMKETFFGLPKEAALLSRMAARYSFDKNGEPVRLPLECPFILTEEYESGGAGLISTTSDYAIFLDALANNGVGKNNNRILLPSTVELMHTNRLYGQQLDDFDKMRKGYGYGLGVRTHINPLTSGSSSPVGEFGWDGAAGAFSMVDTKNQLSLTYFQQIHGWSIDMQNELRNALYLSLVEE